MREAMHRAEVGDDVYGEDRTVRRLEERAAELTGQAAALFVPSGSMANLIAQLVHVRRGDEVLLGQGSHVLFYESGSGAALAGCLYSVIPGGGLVTAEQVAEQLQPGSFYAPRTALVWLENSHNKAGGLVYDPHEIARIAALCRERGLPLHLDGARLFNAALASGVSAATLGSAFDSLSFCLSKGLGAPVGSVLCGSASFRDQALRFRKMLGGAMRQVGVLAAAGLHALEHHLPDLATDHANARWLAEQLSRVERLSVALDRVVTNIVLVDLHRPATEFSAACRTRGVLVQPFGARQVRLVTHRDVTRAQLEEAVPLLGASA
jgi:threonine aldolase